MDDELVEMVFDPIKKGSFFLIDKPKGWTSFDVVNELRGQLKKTYGVKKLKVGHAGTLDPMATGLLICCSGPMTKRIQEFQEAEKEYLATLHFGYRTASHDADSEVVSEHSTKGIDREAMEKVLSKFQGSVEQVPPAHSAVKIDGKRAYEEARKGKTPHLSPRQVEIHEIGIDRFQMPELSLRIRCSKGTYIRSLARDIGEELNSGAYLNALRRTSIGRYHVDDAWRIDELRTLIQDRSATPEDRADRN